MDGTAAEELTGLERSHHDIAVLPGGVAAFLLVGADDVTGVVERGPDGTLRIVAHLDGIGYGGASASGTFHPNALRYYARDDSARRAGSVGAGWAAATDVIAALNCPARRR